ncbi:MAG: right-handed parallel beta-helix repeat-containing protein, partial [Chloroflexi bacterium]|nr:right-handed parallel beta-helix repeat-containing protein [Chloroflexota bacterium]
MTTYYVDIVNGSDGNDGSTGSPWETAQYGIDQAISGDVVRLRDGIYSEVVTISLDNITLNADDGHTPVFDGLWDATYPVPTTGLFPGGDVYNDSAAKFNALIKVRGSGVIVDGFTIRNSTGRCVSVAETGGGYLSSATVRNCVMHTAYTNGIAAEDANNLLFEDNEIYNISLLDQDPGRPVENWYAGIMIREQEVGVGGGTIQRCKIHDSYGEGIILSRDCNHFTVQDSHIWNTRRTNTYFHYAQDCVLQRCSIFATDSWPYPSDGTTFANEINFDGQYTYNTDHLVENNVYYNNKRNISVGFGVSNIGSLKNTTIQHNTFGECQSPSITPQNIKIDHAANSSNIVFKYNVIIQVSGDITNVETSAALTADYNCWHNQSPQASISGVNDIEDNPDLVSPSATLANFNDWDVGNYELTAVSPCVDAATGSTLTLDFYGNTRTNPDMGAIEYGGAPAHTVTASFTAVPVAGTGDTLTTLDASATTTTDPSGIDWFTFYVRLNGNVGWTQIYNDHTATTSHTFTPGLWDVRLVATSVSSATDEMIKLAHVDITAATIGTSLLEPGHWHSRFFPKGFWQQNAFPKYGVAEPEPEPTGGYAGFGRVSISILLFDEPDGVLLADLTERAEISTDPSTFEHGFEGVGVFVPMTEVESSYFYEPALNRWLLICAGPEVIFEGRAQDVKKTTAGLDIVALGSWVATSHSTHTSFWSSTDVSLWRVVTSNDRTNRFDKKYDFDTEGRLF